MRKLILATETFPYGKGEKSFILPELERLRRHFSITVVSHANREQVEEGMCEKLPEDVRIVCFGRPKLSVFDKLKSLVFLIADRDGRREIGEILREKTAKRERLYQTLSFFAQTLSDQKKLKKSGILSAKEPIIYYSFWYTYFCYSAVRVCRQRKFQHVRLVTRAHGIDLYHERIPGNRQPFKHQMEARLHAIFFACDYAKKYYRSNILKNMEESRLHVCRLGTEKTNIPKAYEKPRAWQMVSCSNVIPLKRVPLIIDALALLEEEISWTHIGDGEQMEYVKAYAKEKLGKKGNISYTFAGYVENNEVIRYYREHWVDCFITTSSTEGGCPVSAQEAMKFGIPMIGTAVGGVTEMIRGNGILLSSDPVAEEVAAAIQTMMSLDEEAVNTMRDAALRLWNRDYDTDSNTAKVLKILKNLEYAD